MTPLHIRLPNSTLRGVIKRLHLPLEEMTAERGGVVDHATVHRWGLNNIVDQDHRASNWRVRTVLGFKSFAAATKLIAGIETMRMNMIKKGQLRSSSIA